MIKTAYDHIPACVFELGSMKNVEMSYILICLEYPELNLSVISYIKW